MLPCAVGLPHSHCQHHLKRADTLSLAGGSLVAAAMASPVAASVVPVYGASPGVGIKLFHRLAPNHSLLHFFIFSLFQLPFSVHPLPREFLPTDTPL
jgi:hypothetical protein